MILEIIKIENPILRIKSQEISKDFPELKEILTNMKDTLEQGGVGLAAPQIGLSIRIFIVDLECEGITLKQTFINPKIIEKKGLMLKDYEGCLSIPKINDLVPRPDMIRIKYLDENFDEHDEIYNGLEARVIQHEYDHLEGILFIDRLPKEKQLLIKVSLEIEKRKNK